MKLPETTYIAPEKLLNYLLILRLEDDKSKFLAAAGYTIENWRTLERDLREQILSLEVDKTEQTKHGIVYEIQGKLKGPNGRILAVMTVWMKEASTGQTKFITLYPSKKKP